MSDNIIEMTEEVEGNQIGTKNYRFSKIGEPVPIKSEADSQFDPQCPPSHPLAVSERYRLIFVAHSTGFCVARTKDVMESAKEGESGSTIQELSVVDVSIGKVSILALSADSSALAATIGGDIHFFSVTALRNQEQKPYFFISLSDSICIKDMRWTAKFEKRYLLLSCNGKLYYGVDEDPLKNVMDNVDAVEWSVKGKFVAVARKTVISILSSKFREKLSISLSLKSLIDDSDVNSTIKVDSIRWVRPDCIIVGCFQVTADGKEDNYLVQVITSKEGSITKASDPIVLVFSDVFLGLTDDAVPFASGPHMFLNYLDQCEVAFMANRKNMDQHIVLFGWALDDSKNEAAMIEILNDAWFPRIDSQGNGDDNLIIGISVDKVSQDDSIKLVLGDEEKEVSPCCVLLCLTVDNKLAMFHFFSAAGPTEIASTISDGEEEDTPLAAPSESGLTKISSTAEERVDETHMKKYQQPPAGDRSLMVHPSANIKTSSESTSGNKEVNPLVNSQTFKGGDDQQKGPAEKLNQDKDVQRPFSGQQGTNAETPFLMKPHQDGEEEDTPPAAPSESGLTKISSTTEERVDETHMKKYQQPPAGDRSLMVHSSATIKTSSESTSGNKEVNPLVNSQTFKGGDDQQKGPAEKLNQDKDVQRLFSGQQGTNAETIFLMKPHQDDPGPAVRNFSKIDTQKLGEARSGDNSFLGNFLTDKSNQSTRMGSQMGFKGSTGLPGKTRSSSLQSVMSSPSLPSGKIIPSEIYDDGRSSSLSLSGSVQRNQHDTSETIWSSGHSPGSPFQNPLRLKEFSGPSTSVQPSGHRTSATGLAKIQSLPAVNSSQSSSQENLTPGRSSNYKPHSNRENFRTSSLTVPFNSEPNLSKQSLNVEEMAKELDRLLECIEGVGGFKDTSITLQKSSVVALEEGIWNLSERCRMWRAIMDERHGKIQLLLDKTVQVLARKIYMEGIVKQATDSRYWDLWNLQKLNSELELKQRHIAEVNQDLTNQLIELERHFNTLELNKFGENQVQMNRRAFPCKHGPSRDVQSLHSLRNTMSAQLSAAEQLSECLSKQMSALSIEPSSKKKENVRRELFETIGIPYDNASFNSPGEKGKYGITASENCLISTSAFSKERSLRNYQSSAVKSSEPETVRRSRDSLDQNWASFEPPKTTVKRTLLQEDCQKASCSRSPFLMDKPQHSATTRLQEGSAVARANHSNTTVFSYPSKSKGIQDTPRNFQWGGKLGDSSHHLNRKFSALSSDSGPQLMSARDFDLSTEEGSSSSHHSHQTPSSVPTGLSTQTLGPPKKSSDISVSKESGVFKSTIGNVKDHHPPIFTGSFSFESGKSLKFPVSYSPSSSVLASSSDPTPPTIEAAAAPTKFQPTGEIRSSFSTSVSSSLPPLMLDSSLAPSLPKPTTASPLTTSSKASSIQPAVSSSASSSPIFPSPSSFLSPFKQVPLSTTPPSTNLTSKPSPSLNTEVPKFSFRTDGNTTAEPQSSSPAPPTGTSSALKVEPELPSKPATEPLFTGFSSSTTTTATTASDMALNHNREQPSTAPVVSSSSTSTAALPSSDVAFSQDEDDEMDEEAPEMMNQSIQLTIGNNLSSLGIGSTAPSAAPKPNPFGVSFANINNTAANPPLQSSQFTSMTVPSGELFRPASFSFPSPQPSQPTSFGAFSGGFGQQQQQAAASESGQHALGSVLGSFGQSRQFGTGLPGSGITSAAGGFGGGGGGTLAGNQAAGGFSNAATGGGFASLASAPGGGGFAAAATAGGFAGAASGGGFAGAGGGGSFGGFGNQQGSGGFSAFGSSGGGTARPPSELLTQMRK